jgi:galactokinase
MEDSREVLAHRSAAVFRARFNSAPDCVVSAPGRVNLIGEHTDYNDGFVLPAAINRCTVIAASPRDDQNLVIHAEDLKSTMMLSLGDLTPRKNGAWSNYVAGVALLLQQRGARLRGASMVIHGNIPRGSGLSSSAALEVASAYALMTLSDLDIPELEVIRLCQRAENEFVGVKCGIMDQFISCLGRKDHALRIDCRSLEYVRVPFPAGVRLLVCDTGVKRALASSEYNHRREECSEGVRKLAAFLPGIRMLRDVTPAQLERYAQALDPVVHRRCRHVVTENARVEASVASLKDGRLADFGRLMIDSHMSLRDDYEVSCAELDAVVEICTGCEGVLGARMTGAGFGGCAICLVNEESANAVIERLQREYPERTERTPGILLCTLEDGVSVHRFH